MANLDVRKFDVPDLIRGFYVCLVGRLVVEPLLGGFISSSSILRLLELILMTAMLAFFIALWKKKALWFYKGWSLALFLLFGVSSALIICRMGITGGIKDMIIGKIIETDGVFAYLLPFMVLSIPNCRYIDSILKTFYLCLIFVIPVWLLNYDKVIAESYYGEAVGSYIPFFGAVLLLFRNKFSKENRYVIWGVCLLYLIFMTLNARRNMMVSIVLYLFVAYLFGGGVNQKLKSVLLISGAVLVVFLAWGYLSSGLLERVLLRGMEDTRSQVETAFLIDMVNSPVKDWIIGRGMDGTYFQITQDTAAGTFSSSRNVVETGYLNMLLKGGLLYIITALSFLFTAMFKALKTKKQAIKGLAFFLLITLIELYMTTPISFFGVRTLLFWFYVSVILQYNCTAPKK